MIKLIQILSLSCFIANTSVLLDVQTRELVFKAWPRADDSREFNICKKMNGDVYKFSVVLDLYVYKLSDLQLFNSNQYIELKIPCTQVVGACADAFKAKSAMYTMDFQASKQIITDAASNLRRLDFNRKACVDNSQLHYGQNIEISPGVFSSVLKQVGTAKNCKYPVNDVATISANNLVDQKATINFFAYPDFNFYQNWYSIDPSELLLHTTYACELMPTPEKIALCNNMIETFATSSLGYNQINYQVPALIPARDGTLTRLENYSVIFETNQVKNALEEYFDCYQSQFLMIFEDKMLMTNTMNGSMVNCKQKMSDFVKINYDKIITRVIFQENPDFRAGKVCTIDFVTDQALNETQQWLKCENAVNQTSCKEFLENRALISNFYLSAQQVIIQNNVTKKIFPLQPTFQISCYQITVDVFNTEICANLTSSCVSVPKSTFVTIQLDSLNISDQIIFPQSRICFNHNSSSTFKTGILMAGSEINPIKQINDNTSVQDVKGIIWLLVATAIIILIIIGVGLFIELKDNLKYKAEVIKRE
ncbi:Conserved_hypothetical protein [Hexamita inflata]|uniref:Transmembrane protein n=1 Tax=Hexamita inflata TaxID=28002 RepID=A0AA86P5X7_9EUKA|nr:Conserved hypothetical protein [Hexamita inflata]